MHGTVGAVGVVGGVGGLGQDVESCPEDPAPFIGQALESADVTDAAVAQRFSAAARPERRAGAEWLPNRASPPDAPRREDPRTSSCGTNKNKPATWVVNCRSGGQGPLLHVGHNGHQRTIAGVLARFAVDRQRCPLEATPASCNRKKIAFADPMAFCLQLAANGFKGLPLSGRARRPRSLDGVAFGRRPVAWVELGREVGRGWGAGRSRPTNERIDSTRKVKAFGHFPRRCAAPESRARQIS